MSEPAVTAFFKRFAVKFVEVVGAGIATALSGYLLAHFSGYWSSPASTPPVVQVGPNTGAGTTTSVAKSQRSQPAHAVSADAKEQRLTTATVPVAQPARAAVGAKDSASSRKQLPAEVPAVETKPHDEESVEAQVRAALANVDASHPAPAEVTPRKIDVPPVPSAAAAPPKPPESPPTPAAVASVPPAAETTPSPIEKAVPDPEPLAPVEIKSRPVAAVEESPPVAPVSAVKEEDGDILSMIKKIPDLLRPKSAAADGDAPRPPLPVGN
jgi:hypothetical protein